MPLYPKGLFVTVKGIFRLSDFFYVQAIVQRRDGYQCPMSGYGHFYPAFLNAVLGAVSGAIFLAAMDHLL